MAAGMWVTGVLESRDPGTLRAASMIMSAVAWAAWWAASGITAQSDIGTV